VNRTARLQTATLIADALGLDGEQRIMFLRTATGARLMPSHDSQLPASSLTPTIGRDHEIADVGQLLVGHRLVTLTGPGGIGKTRIAMEVVKRTPEARFTSMAERARGESMLAALAATLRLPDGGGGDVTSALADAMASLRLLVIDNVEHLAHAATGIAELLERLPGLHILTTSRVPLRVPGERVHVVRPLSRAAGVELFTERVADAGADLQGMPDELVDRVCELVDDLPLAIELVAGWTRLFPLAEINRRLADPKTMLAGSSSTGGDRHASIRATVEWSLELLDDADAALFRRLAALPGSSTPAMVEAVVADASGVHLDVLRGLRALVDASLVHILIDGASAGGRIRMLRPIAAVADDLLARHPDERADLETAHASYVVELAESAAPELVGPDQAKWFRVLAQEQHHCEAAIDRLMAARSPDTVRLAAALWRFWLAHGHYRLGLRHLDEVLDLAATLSSGGITVDERARATAVYGRAVIAYMSGDVAAADAGAHEAVARFRAIDDVAGECSVWNLIGLISQYRGDLVGAGAAYRTGLVRADAAEEARSAATLRANLAALLAEDGELGDFREAMSLAEDALDRFQTLGDSRAVADLLGSLAIWVGATGDLARCRDLLHEASELYEATGDRQGGIDVERTLAEAALMAGEVDEAERLYQHALDEATEVGDRWSIASAGAARALRAALAGDENAETAATDALRLADDLEFREGQLHARVAVAAARLCRGIADRAAWLAALDRAGPADPSWTLIAATGLATVDDDPTLLAVAGDVPRECGLIDPWPARTLRARASLALVGRAAEIHAAADRATFDARLAAARARASDSAALAQHPVDAADDRPK
jgi:non-specific serine/threonine protein kinase